MGLLSLRVAFSSLTVVLIHMMKPPELNQMQPSQVTVSKVVVLGDLPGYLNTFFCKHICEDSFLDSPPSDQYVANDCQHSQSDKGSNNHPKYGTISTCEKKTHINFC